MITLVLPTRPDEHDLSVCLVLHHALEVYGFAPLQEQVSTAYRQRIQAIVDDLRCELTDILLSRQATDDNVTLTLHCQPDEHALCSAAVVSHSLEEYRQHLKRHECDGIAYPEYYQQAHTIIDALRYDLIDALLSRNYLAKKLCGTEGRADD